jgi:hypothetical protein
VKIGPRASGFFDDELDALIEELRRERDATPRAGGAGLSGQRHKTQTPRNPDAL